MPAFAGCAASDQRPPAAALPPAHTVNDIDAACFRDRLVSYTVDNGFVIRSRSDTQITAARVVHPIGPSLFSPRALEAPEERITLTLIPLERHSLRVLMAGGYATTGAGFAGTTAVALSAGDVTAFAAQLDRMAAACPIGR